MWLTCSFVLYLILGSPTNSSVWTEETVQEVDLEKKTLKHKTSEIDGFDSDDMEENI